MQTFLPYANFNHSGKSLDPSRLNKQILETRQIMNVLYKKANNLPVKGWANHPAVTMWEGYEWALLQYGEQVHAAYISKGKKEHKAFANMINEHADWATEISTVGVYPDWIGNHSLHSSHRGRLMHKGTLDVLRKYIKEKVDVHKIWPTTVFHKELRDFTVQDVIDACDLLMLSYDNVVAESYYVRFKWVEEPNDEYIWPRDL